MLDALWMRLLEVSNCPSWCMILYENLLVPKEHDGVVCTSISDMHEKQEEKGLCILEENETEHSSDKSELLLSCDDDCITYYYQALT